MDCQRCGTCCAAPDISSLAKPIGVPCSYLDGNNLCSVYSTRPPVCRRYKPDEICNLISAPTLEERVENYLRLFDLQK